MFSLVYFDGRTLDFECSCIEVSKCLRYSPLTDVANFTLFTIIHLLFIYIYLLMNVYPGYPLQF